MIFKYLLTTFMTVFFSVQALSAEWTKSNHIKIILVLTKLAQRQGIYRVQPLK